MDQITLAIGQLLDTFIQRGLTGHQFIGQPDRFDRQFVEEFFAEGQPITFRRQPVFEYLVPGDTKRPGQEVCIGPKCWKASPKFKAGFLKDIIRACMLWNETTNPTSNTQLVTRKQPEKLFVQFRINDGCFIHTVYCVNLRSVGDSTLIDNGATSLQLVPKSRKLAF